MGNRIIYDSDDIIGISDEIKKGISNAVVAAAVKIRDNIRKDFISKSASTYKTHNGDITKLAEGIMIGKPNNNSVKIHAMGNPYNENHILYKTRFFVGGTVYRTQTSRLGKSIKPYSKGYIKPLNSIDEGMSGAQQILNQYINNVINN